MSKYIKFDDAIDCECPLNEIWEDCIDCPLNDSEIEPCKMGKWLKSLPTIEVSEDNEPTWEQVKEYCFKRNFAIVGRETPKEYLRGFAEVSEDAISREVAMDIVVSSTLLWAKDDTQRKL